MQAMFPFGLKILCNGYVTTIASSILKSLKINIFLCNGYVIAECLFFDGYLTTSKILCDGHVITGNFLFDGYLICRIQLINATFSFMNNLLNT